jgi:hypothetical protein
VTGRAAIVGLTGLTFGVGVAARFFRDRRRFGSFSFKNQTRSVSSEIATSSLASDCAISRIDAPARRSVSNTSRYGSSAVKRWDRGCRPAATNCASLRVLSVDAAATSAAHAVEPGARAGESAAVSPSPARGSAGPAGGSAGTAVAPAGGGTVESRARVCCSAADAGASVVCMPVKYRESDGRAMGAVWERSKPKGLDVGVLPHGFLWKLRDNSRHQPRLLGTDRWDFLLKRILGLVLRRRRHGEVDAYAVSSARVVSRSVFQSQQRGASC